MTQPDNPISDILQQPTLSKTLNYESQVFRILLINMVHLIEIL